MAEKKPKKYEGALGGLLNPVWDFLKLLEKMEKEGKTETLKAGEMEGPSGSKIKYQYRVRTLSGGRGLRPITKNPKLIKAEPREKEPLLDVFDKGDYISVIASLPNVKEENLKFKISGNSLKITARTPEGKVEKNIPIPKESKVEKIEKVSFKNGILEIKLKKRRKGNGRGKSRRKTKRTRRS